MKKEIYQAPSMKVVEVKVEVGQNRSFRTNEGPVTPGQNLRTEEDYSTGDGWGHNNLFGGGNGSGN